MSAQFRNPKAEILAPFPRVRVLQCLARTFHTRARLAASCAAQVHEISGLALLAAWVLACLGLACAASGAEPIKDSACLDCHADKTLYKTNAAGKAVWLYVDQAKLKASVHKTNACVSCHSDITVKHPDDNVAAQPPACARCHEKQSESYGASVHGLALAAGRKDAATCSDCHDGHTILPPTSPESPLHFSRLAATCGACHEQAAKDVEESVHGQAVAAGKRDAPTCTDCHSEHKIEALSSSSPLRISADVCSNCHASERLNTKYNLPPDRVKTFFESYHGLAAQYGSTLAANCASCHGVHKILPSSDPRSTRRYLRRQQRHRARGQGQLVGAPHLPGADCRHDRFHARTQPPGVRA